MSNADLIPIVFYDTFIPSEKEESENVKGRMFIPIRCTDPLQAVEFCVIVYKG